MVLPLRSWGTPFLFICALGVGACGSETPRAQDAETSSPLLDEDTESHLVGPSFSASATVSFAPTNRVNARAGGYGINIHMGSYKAWAPDSKLINNFVTDPGIGYTNVRRLFEALGGSTTEIRIPPAASGPRGETTDAFRTLEAGFFDGARARVYRINSSGAMVKIGESVVARHEVGPSPSQFRFVLQNALSQAVQAKDIVFIDLLKQANPPVAHTNPRMKTSADSRFPSSADDVAIGLERISGRGGATVTQVNGTSGPEARVLGTGANAQGANIALPETLNKDTEHHVIATLRAATETDVRVTLGGRTFVQRVTTSNTSFTIPFGSLHSDANSISLEFSGNNQLFVSGVKVRIHVRRLRVRHASVAEIRAAGGTGSSDLYLDLSGHGNGPHFIQQRLQVANLTRLNSNRMNTNADHTFEGWFRKPAGSGVTSANFVVEIQTTGGQPQRIVQAIPLSSTWTKFTHQFRFPATVNSQEASVLWKIEFSGSGSLHADNLRLFEVGAGNPGELRSLIVQRLREYKPQSIRFWGGHSNKNGGPTLASWLNPDLEPDSQWETEKGGEPDTLLSLPYSLKLARSVNAIPWLIFGTFFSEQDLEQMAEYLAGDANTTFGAMRIAHGAPSLADLSRIYLESGNETWNSLFDWSMNGEGFSPPEVYAAFADYQFSIIKRKLTQLGKQSLIPRIRFVANNRESLGYSGDRMGRMLVHGNALDVNNYMGGWEQGQSGSPSTVNVTSLNDLIRKSVCDRACNTEAETGSRDNICTSNRTNAAGATSLVSNILGSVNAARVADGKEPLGILVYEGGPGYALPNPGQTFDANAERLKKSVAFATATLDVFMNKSASGFIDQNYFTMGAGPNWASFNTEDKGWRFHTPVLALQLFNQHAAGKEMYRVDVQTTHVATGISQRSSRCAQLPLLKVWAFKSGSRHAVFVLNREAGRPAQLRLTLPVAPRNLQLHTVTGDALANSIGYNFTASPNGGAPQITDTPNWVAPAIQSTSVTGSQVLQATVRPGAISVYTFDAP